MALIAPDIFSGLYVVSTPIGTASDISFRALDLLAKADIILAEDTRKARHLLNICDIPLEKRKLWSYNDHSDVIKRKKILAALKCNMSIALISDAGTPLIADPGYRLVRDVISEGYKVSSVPGASAIIAAVSVAGLPTDKFFFAGFIPTKNSAKTSLFHECADIAATSVFYESPKRISKSLSQMVNIFGPDREAVICRELTKMFEEIKRGSLLELKNYYHSEKKIKGECVILVDRKSDILADDKLVRSELRVALKTMSGKDATTYVAQKLNISKRTVYNCTLTIKGK